MFRGTEKFPADLYQAKLTGIGADANAYTTDDFTAYHLGITTEDIELVMELESDRFQNLNYPLDMFQTEAGAVYGEYRKLKSNPFFTISEAVRRPAFDKHTYAHTAMGFVEDIQRMPELFDHSRSFFSRFYRPENSILLIVGDFDVQKNPRPCPQILRAVEEGLCLPHPHPRTRTNGRTPHRGSL